VLGSPVNAGPDIDGQRKIQDMTMADQAVLLHCWTSYTSLCLTCVCCVMNDVSASRLSKAMAGGSSSSDFDEFNKQTDDAWDGGDDDLLLEAFNVRISRRDVQSVATQVH